MGEGSNSDGRWEREVGGNEKSVGNECRRIVLKGKNEKGSWWNGTWELERGFGRVSDTERRKVKGANNLSWREN